MTANQCGMPARPTEYGRRWRSSPSRWSPSGSRRGCRTAALALAALLLAPGLALAPLLPARDRRAPLAELAAVPALGFAAASVALISISRVGIALDSWSCTRSSLGDRASPGSSSRDDVAARAPVAGWRPPASRLPRSSGRSSQARVVGDLPLPGNDWAKYVLYADEIRRQGALLIDNPFWMLGVPFREDPATPAVYGAFLADGRPVGQRDRPGHLGVRGDGRARRVRARARLVGPGGGLPRGRAVRGRPGQPGHPRLARPGERRGVRAAGAARWPTPSRCCATAWDGGRSPAPPSCSSRSPAAHRLTASVAVAGDRRGARSPRWRRSTARSAARLLRQGGAGRRWRARSSAGAAVISDLVVRQRTFGGTQPFDAYLDSKVDLDLALRDLTLPFVVIGVVAVVGARARGVARPRRCGRCFALLAVTVAARVRVGRAHPARVPADGLLPAAVARARSRRSWLARRRGGPGGGRGARRRHERLRLDAGRPRRTTSTRSPTAPRCAAWTPCRRACARARSSSPTAAGASSRPGCCTRARCPRCSTRTSAQAAEVPFARRAQAILDGLAGGPARRAPPRRPLPRRRPAVRRRPRPAARPAARGRAGLRERAAGGARAAAVRARLRVARSGHPCPSIDRRSMPWPTCRARTRWRSTRPSSASSRSPPTSTARRSGRAR